MSERERVSERRERVTVRETVMEEESRENESVLERKISPLYFLYLYIH